MSSKNSPGRSENRGDGRRVHRVEREIRETIGSYLLGGFRGELAAMVSVTRVIASKDLRNAKVLFTVMGPEGENRDLRKSIAKELQAHAAEVQRVVNERLRMKYCPRLTFLYDEGFEHAMKVESILRDLSLKRQTEGSNPSETESTESGQDD